MKSVQAAARWYDSAKILETKGVCTIICQCTYAQGIVQHHRKNPELCMNIHRVVWGMKDVSLLPAPSVVEMIVVFVVRLYNLLHVWSEGALNEIVSNEERLQKFGKRDQSSSIAPPDKLAPGSCVCRGTTCLYTLNNCQEHENLQGFVSCMIRVFGFTVYALLDLGVILSFVTLYVSLNFDI